MSKLLPAFAIFVSSWLIPVAAPAESYILPARPDLGFAMATVSIPLDDYTNCVAYYTAEAPIFNAGQTNYFVPDLSSARNDAVQVTITAQPTVIDAAFSFDGADFLNTPVELPRTNGAVEIEFSMDFLKNYQTIFDQALSPDIAECWAYSNGALAFRNRTDADTRLTIAGLSAATWYQFKSTWAGADFQMSVGGLAAQTGSRTIPSSSVAGLSIGGAVNSKFIGQIRTFQIFIYN